HVQPHSVEEASHNNDLALPIIIASTVIIVLGVILMFGLFGRRYRARRRLLQRYYGKMNTRASTLHSPASDEVRLSSASTTSSSVDFRCGPRHSLRIKDIGNMIGRGAFGQVYEANAYITSHDKEPVKVAVKKLKDSATEEEIRNLRDELEQMLNVGSHPNIIGLFGSVFYEGQCCIIMEYAELGDLLTYLKTECAFPLQYVRVGSDGLMVEQSAPKVEDNANLMMFAWQISKGMGHLEMHRVIHRDLATRNCLLTKGPIAKVSDFGLSKDAYELGHYKRIQKDRVPFKWLSPEALLWGQYSSKSDVWAFGVLLWELYTFGGTPYPQVTTEQLRELHEYGYRMSKPPACPDQLYRIMRACWRGDPRQRPSFRQLEETLDQLIQQTRNMEYIDLNEHGLKTSNPLPLLPEDMNDQVTSLDHIYRLKKQSLYQNRSTVPESPELGSSYESITLESGDVLYDETFSRLVAGMSKPDEDRENESTVTSGYLSMRSMSAQTM
ncbi:fibroblast growth factor receptor 2, partial [Biomphalaria glabrata]